MLGGKVQQLQDIFFASLDDPYIKTLEIRAIRGHGQLSRQLETLVAPAELAMQPLHIVESLPHHQAGQRLGYRPREDLKVGELSI